MARIEIYTKPFCPYCDRAMALLDQKGTPYEEIVASMDADKRQEMRDRSGRTTYPQIFIDGRHIGGCDDMMALNAVGELDGLLK